MDDFSTRVQSLPVELFNEVYNLTFAASSSPRTVNKDYKPPHLLRINRHSRALFAKSYYGSELIFCVRVGESKAWIPRLEKAHAEQIGEVRFLPCVDEYEADIATQRVVWSYIIASAAEAMSGLESGTAIKWDDTFKAPIIFPSGERKWLKRHELRALY